MGSRPVNVRLHLRDGRVRERQVDISKGNPEVAMTPAELNVKFEDCARLSLDKAAMQAAAQAVQNIESLKAIAELTRHPEIARSRIDGEGTPHAREGMTHIAAETRTAKMSARKRMSMGAREWGGDVSMVD